MKCLEVEDYPKNLAELESRFFQQTASDLPPRVHRVVSLLRRWLMSTHQGAVSREHLGYYLDEFTFRFNWQTSRSRGKLFYRLIGQAVADDCSEARHLSE